MSTLLRNTPAPRPQTTERLSIDGGKGTPCRCRHRVINEVITDQQQPQRYKPEWYHSRRIVMRTLLLTALATMALSACSQAEHTDQGKHADTIEQPATARAAGDTSRNVPGGGSGTAASEAQDSGHGTGTSAEPKRESPPKP